MYYTLRHKDGREFRTYNWFIMIFHRLMGCKLIRRAEGSE